jgi:protein gp37
MQETSIGWTDYSVNFLKYRNTEGVTVWACVHASEGCRFCYSEALAKRWGRGEAFTAENMKSLTPYFDVKEANQVLKSKKIAGKKVFVDDMSDLFGEWVPDEVIDQHFAIFAMRPDVTFQILTKRAERMRRYLNRDIEDRLDDICHELPGALDETWHYPAEWPLRNVHPGVSIEDQKTADDRVPHLLQTRAAVRWVSAEPLLGAVDFGDIQETLPDGQVRSKRAFVSHDSLFGVDDFSVNRIDGIVIGGETGAGHREMPLVEALVLAESARAAGVSVYFKQDSGPRPGMQGRIPDDVWAMKEWPSAA